MIIDDSARFRDIACRVLKTEGIDVVGQAADGASALHEIARAQPDVILLDIGLPGTSGLEIARRLRADQARPVVILISTREAELGQRLAAGVAAGYLPKSELSAEAIVRIVSAQRCR